MKNQADYEGVGLYERLEEGPSIAEEFRLGIYQRRGVGQLPDPAILAPLLAIEERGGLMIIAADKQAMAAQALDLLTLKGHTGTDPMIAVAEFVVGIPVPWVQAHVAQGFMILVNAASIPTGVLGVMMTRQPAVIAASAHKGADWVIVTGPLQLAAAASQLLQPSVPAPAECPGGEVWAPALNKCVDAGTGVEDGAPQPAAAAATKPPSWLLPAAVGTGVLVVGLVIFRKRG